MRNPNFTCSSRRGALDGANLVGLRSARIARIAASDATIDDLSGNRIGLFLPRTGLYRNLLGIGLRNHRAVRNLFRDGLGNGTHDRVATLTLFGDRSHDSIADLLRNRIRFKAIDGIGASLLLSNGNHNGIRNLLLALLDDATIHRVATLTLFGDRNHDGVINLLRNFAAY